MWIRTHFKFRENIANWSIYKKMNFHHFEHAANVCKTRGFAHIWQSFLERVDQNSKFGPRSDVKKGCG